MSKLVILFLFTFTLVGFEFPEQAGDTPVTLIEGANLICEDSGALIAIRTVVDDEKVWQSDPGMKEGFELSIGSFGRARCLNTYSIEATLTTSGQTLPMTFETRGTCHGNQGIELDIYIDHNFLKTIPCEEVE